MSAHEQLLQEFQTLACTAPNTDVLMQAMAKRLHETMPRYNWVGFYLIDPADEGVLIISPYMGSFTPNVRIPLNTGLCGAAASAGKTVVVNDVSNDDRYLSGSSLVKSEIVVPIFAGGKLKGELDVESYFASTFTEAEQTFVEACADVVAKYLLAQ